jgi:mannitol/fructose-specific phosphotransferase system IIA component (Ntr-type)
MAATGRCTDEQQLLKAVFDREAIRSTGIGQGLAVPHGKCNCCESLVMALGKPASPIDFDSKDGQPADLIVLLASPHDQTGPHIQALARISRLMLMDEFRSAMSQAHSAEEVYQIISKFEA